MFEPETVAFLEGGCSLIVGVADASIEPFATRGWGLTVLPGPGATVRLLLSDAECGPPDRFAVGTAIAVTGADVLTLHSLQLKGRVAALEPATDDDRARAGRFCDDFFTDIVMVDGTPRPLLERLEPIGYAACTVEVHEVFDQTPGPHAGAPVAPTREPG